LKSPVWQEVSEQEHQSYYTPHRAHCAPQLSGPLPDQSAKQRIRPERCNTPISSASLLEGSLSICPDERRAVFKHAPSHHPWLPRTHSGVAAQAITCLARQMWTWQRSQELLLDKLCVSHLLHSRWHLVDIKFSKIHSAHLRDNFIQQKNQTQIPSGQQFMAYYRYVYFMEDMFLTCSFLIVTKAMKKMCQCHWNKICYVLNDDNVVI